MKMSLGQMMLILPIVLVICAGMSAEGGGTDDCYCPEVVFLQYGRDGVVQCLGNNFDFVSWYITEDYESEQPPLVTVDTVNEHGEYGIDMTGSLTIKNVSLRHDGEYTVLFANDEERRTVTEAVRVVVVAHPVPEYPVVEGQFHHRYVRLDVEKNGVVHCSMAGVHPLVNLTWKMDDQSARHKVHFVHHTTESTLNKNGTYNVVLTSQYQAETFTEKCNIKCQIDGQISEYFQWNQTTVELNFHTASPIPVIDGCYNNRDHCVLEVKRAGEMTCYVTDSPFNVNLTWELQHGDVMNFDFEKEKRIAQDRGNSFDISISTPYMVPKGHGNKVTVHCNVMEHDQLYSKAKASFVVFDSAYEVRTRVDDNGQKVLTIVMFILITMVFALEVFLIVITLKARRQDYSKSNSEHDSKVRMLQRNRKGAEMQKVQVS